MNMHAATTRLFRTVAIGACALAITASAPSALAQPADATPPADSTTNGAAERDAMRARIQHQLDSLDSRREQLRVALDRLDAGAPIEDIRAELVPTAPPNRGPDRGFDRGHDRGPGDFRGPHAGAPRPNGANAPALTPEQVDRMLEFLRAHKPDIAADLDALRERDPEAFERKLADIRPRLQSLIERFDEGPERFKVMVALRHTEERAFDLARRIVGPDNATDAPDLTLQLRETVAEGFNLRRRLHEIEIDDVRARLDDLETRSAEMTTGRDTMIDRHVAELIDMAASGDGPPAPRERWRRFFEERRDGRRREDARPRPEPRDGAPHDRTPNRIDR